MGNLPPTPISSGPYEPYFEFYPVKIKNAIDKSRSITLRGAEIINGIECYHIQIDTRELEWHVFINTQTYLLEYWSCSPGGDESTLTKVFDYKKFGDYLIPTSEIKTKDGRPFFYSNIKRLELNADIDPSIFKYEGK